MWIPVESASNSIEVPDHGLTMLLKLGAATKTWKKSECFMGGVRDQVSLGHEGCIHTKDRDMAVGNEYRLVAELGLFNTPRSSGYANDLERCCNQRTTL